MAPRDKLLTWTIFVIAIISICHPVTCAKQTGNQGWGSILQSAPMTFYRYVQNMFTSEKRVSEFEIKRNFSKVKIKPNFRFDDSWSTTEAPPYEMENGYLVTSNYDEIQATTESYDDFLMGSESERKIQIRVARAATDQSTPAPDHPDAVLPGSEALMSYGGAADTALPSSDDDCTRIQLVYRIKVWDTYTRHIYICMNGLVTFFQKDSDTNVPHAGQETDEFKSRYRLAAFWTDLDTTQRGQVLYRIVTNHAENPELFESAKTLIREEVGDDFSVDQYINQIVVITWDSVGHFQAKNDATEVATFQIILVSSGSMTFAWYAYKQNAMDITKARTNLFIGATLGSSFFDRLENSNNGEFLLRPDCNVVYNDRLGYYLYEVSNVLDPPSNTDQCINIWNDELQHVATYRNALADSIPMCPCTLEQWLQSTQFFTNNLALLSLRTSPTTNCYQTTEAHEGYSINCCYNVVTEELILSGNDKSHFLKEFPGAANYFPVFKDLCCKQSSNCDRFFEVRPIHTDQCEATTQNGNAGGVGDPHIITLDNFEYTFNGLGEYVLVSINALGKTFLLQARTERALKADSTLSDATVFSAFAATDNTGETVMVQQNLERNGMLVYVSGGDYSLEFNNMTKEFNEKFKKNLQLSRFGKSILIGFINTKIALRISQDVGMLTFRLFIPKEFKTHTQGLLGNFNDNADDDMIKQGETTAIARNSSEQDILQFGESWKTTRSSSIFKYINGKNYDIFTDVNFTPKFLSDFSQEKVTDAEDFCRAGDVNSTPSPQCVFDYLSTDDAAVANNTNDAVAIVNHDTIVTTNRVPVISVVSGLVETSTGYSVQVIQGQESKFVIKAEDDGTANLEFTTNTVDATLGTADSNGNQEVAFTLTTSDVKVLSIIAKDDKDIISPPLDVIINFCTGCNEQGTCDFTDSLPDSRSTEFFIYASCDCNIYYSGSNCETDFDACTENPCSTARTCEDVAAAQHISSGVGYTCGPCPIGFEDDGSGGCQDVDECAATQPVCDQLCDNVVGSYQCSCNPGYRLSTPTTCADINECEELTSACPQICTNNEGGFTCSCNTGYTYDSGTNVCNPDTPPDLCLNKNCNNADGCTVDDQNNAVCFCNKGYRLTNTDTCENIDECALGQCSQTCNDTIGSYECSCVIGYKLSTDQITCEECDYPTFGVNCAEDCRQCSRHITRCDPARGCICATGWQGSTCSVDIDECTTNNPCTGLESCVNTQGSYICECPSGFQKDVNNSCQDIDECQTSTMNNCQQECVNSLGGYTCTCFSGFTIDPNNASQCLDIDECAAGTSGCQQICDNVSGRFNCDCFFGYELEADRKTCQLVADPCASELDLQCSDLCLFLGGTTAQCRCYSGYSLGADNQTCYDINECDDNLGLNGCSEPSSCVNKPGSYECSCSPGFRLDNDQRKCIVCEDGYYGDNCANQCQCGTGLLRCDSVTGCVCKPGLTGELCNIDVNECEATTSPCTGDNVQCINVEGSYRCECLTGFARDSNNNCIDIDECADSSLHNCQQLCTNTVGSFTCSCAEGFTTSGNTCTNINECQGAHGCGQICTDTAGGFRCSCNAGFRLDSTNQKDCLSENVCDAAQVATCGANSDCTVVSGAVSCICRSGFEDDGSNTNTCTDIKECDQTNPTVCTDDCTELEGSFSCSCTLPGFELGADGTSCTVCDQGRYGVNCAQNCSCIEANSYSCNVFNGACNCTAGWEGVDCGSDIDECDSSPCPDNSVCTNTNGSFTCTCDIGFAKSGSGTCEACDGKTTFGTGCSQACQCEISNTASCNTVNGTCTCLPGYHGDQCETDINECANDVCTERFQKCENIPGSFRCVCRDGFATDASGVCQDVDECTLGLGDCQQICTNTVGAFSCSCNPGYTGTRTCTDVDECASATLNQCSETDTCANTVGDYTCSCPTGYELDTDRRTCIDIDECTIDTDGCQQTCTNTVGSFTCSCIPGFSGSVTCTPCENNKHGDNCISMCDCVDGHTTGDRICSATTGVCNCSLGWTNTTCNTDVNECALNTHDCVEAQFKKCYNTEGGFECTCEVGYEPDNTGSCIQSTATTTPLTPVAGESVASLRMVLDYTVPPGEDLTAGRTNDEYKAELNTVLTDVYPNDDNVNIVSVASGSLIVVYQVALPSNEAAAAAFAEVNKNMAKQTLPLTVFGQTSLVTSLSINDKAAAIGESASVSDLRCLFFTEGLGSCPTDHSCQVENDVPTCLRDATTDNLPLILGLGVGIPLFLLAICIIILVVCLLQKRKRRKNRQGYNNYSSSLSSDQGIFATTIPKAYNHRRHMHGGGTFARGDDWESESEASSDTRRHRDPRDDYRRQRDTSRTGPSYIYDNPAQKSNFSWDFLYRNMTPREEYRIQRPHVSQQPRYW